MSQLASSQTSPSPLPHQWIDAHAHLADERISPEQLRAWIEGAEAAGISQWVLGGVGPEDWKRQKDLHAKYPEKIRMSFGLHPWWVAEHTDEECTLALEELEKEFSETQSDRRTLSSPLSALGETGLDFHDRFSENTHPHQEYFFRAQIQLALRMQIPLVLHVVQAHERALQILEQEGVSEGSTQGIIHSFAGDLSFARRYLRMGLVPSISAPVITREKGKSFESLSRTVLSLAPNEFVIETDSPDQPPEEGKGGMNPPVNLIRVAKRVAELRGENYEAVLDRSAERLRSLFPNL